MPKRRRSAAVAVTVAALAAAPAVAQPIVPALEREEDSSLPGAPAQPGQQQTADGTPQAKWVPPGPPPRLDPVAPDPRLAPREARAVGLASRHRTRACTPVQRSDGTLVFRHGTCEPVVVCAVFRACDVSLEPGEMPTSEPTVADPRVGLQKAKVSGSGDGQTVHLVFQPADAGLSSGVILHTNRRTVSFVVQTTRARYMPLVALEMGSSGGGEGGMSWASLAAMGQAGVKPIAGPGATGDVCDGPPTVAPTQFSIQPGGGMWGGEPAWKPLQVYVVAGPSGPTTCVEFPADIRSLGAPVLVPRDGPGGSPGVDNVFVKGRRYVVHREVRRFDLMAGIGGSQERVSVRRK